MDGQFETMSKRVLLLLKLDSTRLMQKIVTREDQYLSLLSIKRTRVHFDKVFENRYKDTPIQELKFCSDKIIQEIYNFYNIIDDMQWYLGHTEDLPGAIKDKVDYFIADLNKAHEKLISSINIELGEEDLIAKSDFVPELEEEQKVEEENFEFEFSDEGKDENLTDNEISEEVLKDLSS